MKRCMFETHCHLLKRLSLIFSYMHNQTFSSFLVEKNVKSLLFNFLIFFAHLIFFSSESLLFSDERNQMMLMTKMPRHRLP
jgi:hypothetical protein